MWGSSTREAMLSLRKAWRRVLADGVGADAHAGGGLAVVQSFGDEGGDSLLGVGSAEPGIGADN